MSKKLRHAKKLDARAGKTVNFGTGKRGSNRDMRRNPAKYGLSNSESKKLLDKGLING